MKRVAIKASRIIEQIEDSQERLNAKSAYLKFLGVSEDTIKMVTNINGWNDQSFNDMLNVIEGEHDFSEYEEVY